LIAMPLEKSEAVILKTFNWSESSRTVVFFTKNFGRLRLTDRGGRSMKSRRGRLTPFARIDLTFYASEKETAGYIRDADITHLFEFAKEGTLGRLAYGSAACELLYLLLPEQEPQPQLYAYLITFLEQIDSAPKRGLPPLFTAFFLRLLSQLGYHPSLAYCVISGDPVSDFTEADDQVAFSPERGGVVSPACQQAGEHYIRLPSACFDALLKLQTASLAEAAAVRLGFTDAAVILDALATFLRYQADLPTGLKSLEFIEKLKHSRLNG
jgi:DNA repair protein RecO (recombination protein O)